MLRFVSFDIVFQEVPDETTLALNISNCPHHCKGCHSPWLWGDNGEVLDEAALDVLMKDYGRTITCVCFMGGDGDLAGLYRMAAYVRKAFPSLKTAWYSGLSALPEGFPYECFDYVKIGPYIEDMGPLKSPDTNQRFYAIENGDLTDRTSRFWKK